MYFNLDNGARRTEALVTAITYDRYKEMYCLAVLGMDGTGYNYTVKGEAWFDDEDFDALVKSGELEFPHNLIGRKIKLIANGVAERNTGDDYE